MMVDSKMNHDKASFERRLTYPYHVSTATFLATWSRAPPNLDVIMSMDTNHFSTSTFCSTAYEFRPYPDPRDPRHSIRCRIYTSQKVLITGCRHETDAKDALDRLSTVTGGMDIDRLECQLININITLPWTVNSNIINALQRDTRVRLVEEQDHRPSIIIHIQVHTNTIRKVLLYKTGKVSLHVSNWRDAEYVWTILEPALESSRGLMKSCES